MLLSRRFGCRVVLHIHGAGFDDFADSAGWFSRRLVRRCLSLADRVVALSEEWRRRLQRISSSARITVIENAVAAIPTVRRMHGSNRCRFLLLARMDVWKGVDDLLDACVLLQNRSSAIFVTLSGPPGSAGDADALRAKIADRNLDTLVEYAGPVDGEGKGRLLAQTDVLVQPSHQEGMPMAMLEALADGIPVVATRVGGIPDVITDGREGLLVPPRRPDLLAEAMHVLAGDAERRTRMSAQARALALSRFGAERFNHDLLRLYDDLMNDRRSSQDSAASSPLSVRPRGMATPTAIP
jgi:glycosyltransferase involved in cell wall biosynthesis